MEILGTGIFDNDESRYLLNCFDNRGELHGIMWFLSPVLSHREDIIHANEANRVLVICEAIARMQGNFGEEKNDQTEILDRLVAKYSYEVSPRMAAMALSAIEFILTEPSEILNAWSTAEDLAAWKNNVENLKKRIRT